MKKGTLMINNTLELVLSVLGLTLLIAGSILLFNNITKSDFDNARKALDVIENKALILEEGEEGLFTFRGPSGEGAKNWLLIGWSSEEEGKPDRCLFDSCICVCYYEGDPSIALKERVGMSCQNTEKAVCRKIDEKEIAIKEKFRIDGENVEKEFIVFPKNLLEVEMKKTTNGLEIFYDNPHREINYPNIEGAK